MTTISKTSCLYATVTNATAGLPNNEVSMDYDTNGERVYKSTLVYWQELCGGGGGILNSVSTGGGELDVVPTDTTGWPTFQVGSSVETANYPT